jgi:hypothetical protein
VQGTAGRSRGHDPSPKERRDWRDGHRDPGPGRADCDRRGSDGHRYHRGWQRVTATIPVGNGPVGVAVNPSTGAVYAAHVGDDTVSVISG